MRTREFRSGKSPDTGPADSGTGRRTVLSAPIRSAGNQAVRPWKGPPLSRGALMGRLSAHRLSPHVVPCGESVPSSNVQAARPADANGTSSIQSLDLCLFVVSCSLAALHGQVLKAPILNYMATPAEPSNIQPMLTRIALMMMTVEFGGMVALRTSFRPNENTGLDRDPNRPISSLVTKLHRSLLRSLPGRMTRLCTNIAGRRQSTFLCVGQTPLAIPHQRIHSHHWIRVINSSHSGSVTLFATGAISTQLLPVTAERCRWFICRACPASHCLHGPKLSPCRIWASMALSAT